MNIKEFRILHDNILIKPLIVEEVNGLVRPQQYEDKPELGEVIKVGDGREFDSGIIRKLKIKEGDTVLFNKYSSTKVAFEGIDYLILREEDIRGERIDSVIREIDKLDKLSEEEVKENLKKYNASSILEIFKKPENYFERYQAINREIGI